MKSKFGYSSERGGTEKFTGNTKSRMLCSYNNDLNFVAHRGSVGKNCNASLTLSLK